MKKIQSALPIFLFFLNFLNAQSPAPAPAQKGSTLILGATAHLGNGETIENSAIAFEKGLLTLVADARVIRIDQTKYSTVVDASGKHVWPGFVALNTRIGLVEVEAARATRDFEEVGTLNPNVRALVAYNADSEVPPTLRALGVLTAQIVPEGGTISGQSSVVQLDAWGWEEAAVAADEGLHLRWPEEKTWGGWQTGQPEQKKNEQYQKTINDLSALFAEAKAYASRPAPDPKNLKLEALRGLFDGSKKLYLHAQTAKTIEESVLFAQKWNCRAVLVGGAESWLVADFLKRQNVPVVLDQMHSLPMREDSDVDQPFKTPAQLEAAGVEFAISHNGSWRARNLPFQAGQAVAFGLSKEKALEAVTLAPARILGLDKKIGSLEVGKDATFFISAGDALDMRGCLVEKMFISGREAALDDRQKKLAKKFRERLERKGE